MNRKFILFAPLFVVLIVCVLLFLGLQQDPKQIISALIGKPVPEFFQTDLQDPTLVRRNKDLPKEAFVLNIWGSWCYYCKQEHSLLQDLANQGVKIVGVNYRDNRQNALNYLQQSGDPFLFSIDDPQGKLAMQLGVDGAPESYIIDRYGVIRYRYSGAFSPEIIQKVILPELEKLK